MQGPNVRWTSAATAIDRGCRGGRLADWERSRDAENGPKVDASSMIRLLPVGIACSLSGAGQGQSPVWVGRSRRAGPPGQLTSATAQAFSGAQEQTPSRRDHIAGRGRPGEDQALAAMAGSCLTADGFGFGRWQARKDGHRPVCGDGQRVGLLNTPIAAAA